METVGFSTGSLACADLPSALQLLGRHYTEAVELSALRRHELGPLLQSLPHLPLDRYRHIAVHAPSTYGACEERPIAEALLPVAERGWYVVLHPDAIHDVEAWAPFGSWLCIENMDRRKPCGRTVEELLPIFDQLPDASFCFDVAHARQCDTSMTEAYRLLSVFGDRLRQIHISELDPASRHVRLSSGGIRACREIADLIPYHVPVIIEARVEPHEIEAEIDASLQAVGRRMAIPRAA